MTPLRTWTSHRLGEKYLQNTYVIKDLYPEYIQNSYNSIIGQPDQNWTDFNKHFTKVYEYAHENKLNITGH